MGWVYFSQHWDLGGPAFTLLAVLGGVIFLEPIQGIYYFVRFAELVSFLLVPAALYATFTVPGYMASAATGILGALAGIVIGWKKPLSKHAKTLADHIESLIPAKEEMPADNSDEKIDL